MFHNWKNDTEKLVKFWFKIIYTNAGYIKNTDFHTSFERPEFTIPDGSYSVEDIENYIHLILNKIESTYDFTRDDFGINLYANSKCIRVSIEIN